MKAILNDDDLSEVASEFLISATATEDDDDDTTDPRGIEHKINKLKDVRERLHELRSIVSNYEV